MALRPRLFTLKWFKISFLITTHKKIFISLKGASPPILLGGYGGGGGGHQTTEKPTKEGGIAPSGSQIA